MVVPKKESEESLNQLFRALADGTRRDILARSLTETPSVSALAARYQMSFAAVQKDVAKLTLTVAGDYPVPQQRLWDAFADPRQLERFWGPPPPR